MISLSEGITLPQYEHRSWPGGRGEDEEEVVVEDEEMSVCSTTGDWLVVRRVWPEWDAKGDSWRAREEGEEEEQSQDEHRNCT